MILFSLIYSVLLFLVAESKEISKALIFSIESANVSNKSVLKLNQQSIDLCTTNIHEICYGHNEFRIGCCKPNKVQILENIRFNGNTIEMYGLFKNLSRCAGSFELPSIPLIATSFKRQFVRKDGILPVLKCKRVFEGTLHVMGHTSAENLFHACKNRNALNYFHDYETDTIYSVLLILFSAFYVSSE